MAPFGISPVHGPRAGGSNILRHDGETAEEIRRHGGNFPRPAAHDFSERNRERQENRHDRRIHLQTQFHSLATQKVRRQENGFSIGKSGMSVTIF